MKAVQTWQPMLDVGWLLDVLSCCGNQTDLYWRDSELRYGLSGGNQLLFSRPRHAFNFVLQEERFF
jgi:hypothetical protein